jgi:hypothetical protein
VKVHLEDKYVKLEEAIAYQVDGNGNIIPLEWTGTYYTESGTAHVKITTSGHDPSLPLVLLIGYPPLPMGGGGGTSETANLTWSTTVGSEISSFSSLGDMIFGGDAMPDHDLLVCGMTGDDGFPAITGETPTTINWDVFVSRFDHAPGDTDNDARLLWTTFLIGGPSGPVSGQASGNDSPTSIKYVVGHDAIYVAGSTNSTAWPMMPVPDPNDGTYYQVNRNGLYDAFIARLDQGGELVRSTLYGGPGLEIISSIIADGFDRVFFFGNTTSSVGTYANCGSSNTGLPLCDPGGANYQQAANAGGTDMFVARFDPDFELTWGSFIGGAGDDLCLDANYSPGPGENSDWVGIVGRSTGSLPYLTVTDSYQLNNATSGFVWLFTSSGKKNWGTHLHGTVDAQAIQFTKDNRVRVAGVLPKLPTSEFVVASCLPVSGFFSVCDGDPTTDYIANYLALFDTDGYTLEWSTILGDYVDARHNLVSDLYWGHLLGTDRYMDMVGDAEDNYILATTVANLTSSDPSENALQQASGMYYKAWDPGAGNEQSDVVLYMHDVGNQLLWSSAFGASFPHMGEFFDANFVDRGSDLAHSLVWNDGEVLYLVGSSGGNDFDRQCPFPDQSYCELNAGPMDGITEQYDGMIARFDMRTIGVGVAEPTPPSVLVVYPSPSAEHIRVSGPDWLNAGCSVRITDVSGRVASEHMLGRDVTIPVYHLAAGSYTLQVAHTALSRTVVTRFIKR